MNGASHAVVRVLSRATRSQRRSHPWIFRDDVVDAGGARGGDLVRVVSESGASLGYGLYSASSKIALRRVTSAESPPDDAFWASRVDAAWRWRGQVVSDSDAFRVIFGESDGIPGLVVDRYAEHLVVQCLTAAAERLLPVVLEALGRRMPIASVLARNDPAVRTLEGLPRETRQVEGTTPERIEVREASIRYTVNPWKGQKTGAFLDQRDNRSLAEAYSRGRVLDAFCYEGNFALRAAPNAAEVIGLDSSATALARARENAALNSVSNSSFVQANAFEELRRRQQAGESFDLVVLDPPAFAKSRADLKAARRAYKEINLRAMRLLSAEGILLTSSCSYNLSEAEFLEVLVAAAHDSRKEFRLVEKRSQSRDHPVRLGFPESHYLKCLVLCMI